MRENKYRAWDKRNEFMLVHNRIADISFKYECLHYDSIPPESLSDIDFKGDLYTDKNGIHIDVYFNDIILMQYTGLLDKNGKEIYEGDIVKYGTGEHSEIAEVYYNEDCCKLSLKYISRRWINHTFDVSVLRQGEYNVSEIIGNIKENPELLEKK